MLPLPEIPHNVLNEREKSGQKHRLLTPQAKDPGLASVTMSTLEAVLTFTNGGTTCTEFAPSLCADCEPSSVLLCCSLVHRPQSCSPRVLSAVLDPHPENARSRFSGAKPSHASMALASFHALHSSTFVPRRDPASYFRPSARRVQYSISETQVRGM